MSMTKKRPPTNFTARDVSREIESILHGAKRTRRKPNAHPNECPSLKAFQKFGSV